MVIFKKTALENCLLATYKKWHARKLGATSLFLKKITIDQSGDFSPIFHSKSFFPLLTWQIALYSSLLPPLWQGLPIGILFIKQQVYPVCVVVD